MTEEIVQEDIKNNTDTTSEDTDSSENTNTGGDTNTSKQASSKSLLIISEAEHPRAKWYVVHTYSGHELKVAQLLKQRVESMGHMDKVFKVLVPQMPKIVVSEGKKRKVDERLFPGYVIVYMVIDDDTWYMVRSTPGVTGFVGTGSNPTPLPKKEVEEMLRLLNSEAPKFETKFSVGDSVKITEGPFAEFLGKLEEVNEEQGKLKVLVSVFGRETPVELDFTQVKSL